VQKSPLYNYIPPGSIITKLDDNPLGTTNTSQDPWTSYLKTPPASHPTEPTLGWCAGPLRKSLISTETPSKPHASFTEPAEQCCSLDASPGLSCFTSIDTPSNRGCLNPIPILTALKDDNRCSSNADCHNSSSTCVSPDKIERLLRLRVERPSENWTEVVLWSGPKEEVWNEGLVFF
jgi:S2P endopeptidase